MECINSYQALEINKARSIFTEVLHVGCPCKGKREVILKYAEKMVGHHRLPNNGGVVQKSDK